MADTCDHAQDDHAHPAASAGTLGIPRSGGFDGVAFEQAIADLLRACGVAPDGAPTAKTPQRVRELCERRLLGEDRRGDERVYTQAFAGCFNTDDQARCEFLRAIGGHPG